MSQHPREEASGEAGGVGEAVGEADLAIVAACVAEAGKQVCSVVWGLGARSRESGLEISGLCCMLLGDAAAWSK